MTKKTTPLVALVGVPIITGVIASFFIADGDGVINFIANVQTIPAMIQSGLGTVWATAVMFIFSILFFGVLIDAGTFRPIVKGVIDRVGADPAKIAVGTAFLAMLLHLDGSGATTFLVVIPAMLPIYKALNMRLTTLTAITGLAAGTMNIVPWGGPTIRAIAVMESTATEVWNPIIISQAVGLITVLVFAFFLGKAEKKNLTLDASLSSGKGLKFEQELTDEQRELLRPKMMPVNILLLVCMIAALVGGGRIGITPASVFIVLFVLALVLNYRSPKLQRERVDASAKSAVMMASVILSAGVFTGIMRGTGMITEMSHALVNIIPEGLGRFFPIITGIIAMPASLLFDPDSFYFGVLPTLATTAEAFGVDGINVARAAILGQMSTGFPVSPLTPATFLLVGLAGVEIGDHQKRMIPLAFAVTIIMLIVSLITGAIAIS